jgi:hypothetical protein
MPKIKEAASGASGIDFGGLAGPSPIASLRRPCRYLGGRETLGLLR